MALSTCILKDLCAISIAPAGSLALKCDTWRLKIHCLANTSAEHSTWKYPVSCSGTLRAQASARVPSHSTQAAVDSLDRAHIGRDPWAVPARLQSGFCGSAVDCFSRRRAPGTCSGVSGKRSGRPVSSAEEGSYGRRSSNSNGNGSSKYKPEDRITALKGTWPPPYARPNSAESGSSYGGGRIPEDDMASYFESTLREMEGEAANWQRQYEDLEAEVAGGPQSKLDDAWNLMSEAELRQMEEDTAELRNDIKDLYTEVMRLYRSGGVPEARALIEANLSSLQEQLDQGVDGVEQAALLQVLAHLQFMMGELNEVEPLLAQTSSLLKKVQDPEPMLDEVLENMGDLYNGLEKPEEAADWFQRSIEMKEKARGKHSLELVEPLISLGHTYMGMEEFSQAVPLYRRAIGIIERALGPDTGDLAVPLSFLGHALLQIEQSEEGEKVLSRVLSIVERTDGPGDESTGMAVCSVARAKAANGDYDSAVSLFRKGLGILNDAGVKEDDLALEAVRNDLAEVLTLMDKDEEAQEIWRQNLEIRERVVGPDDTQLIPHLQNLATSYAMFEDFEKVEPLMKRSVELAKKELGAEAPEVSIPMEHYATTLFNLRRYDEAETVAREVLRIREKAFGSHGMGVAESCNQLAATLHAQGKDSEAEILLWRALKIMEGEASPNSESVLEILQALEIVLTALGRQEEARPLVIRANRIKRRLMA